MRNFGNLNSSSFSFNQLRWLFAVVFLLVGILSVDDWDAPRWAALTLGLFAAPLLSQLIPSRALRVYALWFGSFLLLQTLMTPVILDPDFFTLQKNLVDKHVYLPGEILGIVGYQRVTTDGKGFRTTKVTDYQHKPHGNLRIFAVGGSTTEQIVLDDRKTWTHLLQEHLQQALKPTEVEVINTGLAGLRAKHHYATLRHIAGYEPDIVLFMMGFNDWNRHVIESLSPELLGGPGRLREHNGTGSLNFRRSLLGRAIVRMSGYIFPKKIQHAARRNGSGVSQGQEVNSLMRPIRYTFRPTAVNKDYAEQLDSIARKCVSMRVTCVFITQPTAYQGNVPEELHQRFWMTPPYTNYSLDIDSLNHLAFLYNKHLLQFANKYGFPACDLASEIQFSASNFSDDCHFTTSGARQVAQVLYHCLHNVVQAELSKQNPDLASGHGRSGLPVLAP